MKFTATDRADKLLNHVAPHVGAWIEISALAGAVGGVDLVAPHVGAWIEIPIATKDDLNNRVAPHVGAWIEMSSARVAR